MSACRILVLAPEPDLRRSLAFALEAEGYEVVAHAVLLNPGEARDFDSVVVDQKALTVVPRDVALSFCSYAAGIVLLAATPEPWLAAKVFCVLRPPHLGEALVAAVRSALGERAVAPDCCGPAVA